MSCALMSTLSAGALIVLIGLCGCETQTPPTARNAGGAEPVAGAEPPVAGVEPPVAGVEPPVAGAEPPVAGVEPPVAGVEPAVAGAESMGRLDGLPEPPSDALQLSFPIAPSDRALIRSTPIIGVDHDPSEGSRLQCTGHDGGSFPSCYDGHEGSDFLLDGGFETMDAGSAHVIAAASGVVIETRDGEYDRCHADLFTGDISCDGYPARANFVTLEHEGGWRTSYLHLKSGSVLVREGERVSCGQPLALIGSSGNSSAPHLHLQIEDEFGRVWDPFAGDYSQAYSLWRDEGGASGDGLPLNLCEP